MEISIIPRWLISRFSKDYLRQNDLSILISNVCIILIFFLFQKSVVEVLNSIPHFCLFDKLTGVECPVCGTTRAFCELADGNIKHAFRLNLSSVFVAAFFIFQIPLRLFSLYRNESIQKINLISKCVGNVVLIVIVVSWLVKMSMQ